MKRATSSATRKPSRARLQLASSARKTGKFSWEGLMGTALRVKVGYRGFLISFTIAVATVFLLNMGLWTTTFFGLTTVPFTSPFLGTGTEGLSLFLSACFLSSFFLSSCFLSSCPWAPFLPVFSMPGTGCSGFLGNRGTVTLMDLPFWAAPAAALALASSIDFFGLG